MNQYLFFNEIIYERQLDYRWDGFEILYADSNMNKLLTPIIGDNNLPAYFMHNFNNDGNFSYYELIAYTDDNYYKYAYYDIADPNKSKIDFNKIVRVPYDSSGLTDEIEKSDSEYCDYIDDIKRLEQNGKK